MRPPRQLAQLAAPWPGRLLPPLWLQGRAHPRLQAPTEGSIPTRPPHHRGRAHLWQVHPSKLLPERESTKKKLMKPPRGSSVGGEINLIICMKY